MEVSWRLRMVLAHRRIPNAKLAKELGFHEGSVSRLKNMDTLPAIGNDEIKRICQAITKLSRKEFGTCKLSDLIVLIEDSEDPENTGFD